MCRSCWLSLALFLVLCGTTSPPTAAGGDQVTFENERFRIGLGNDAVWQSIFDKTNEIELCPNERPVRFAAARVGPNYLQAGRLAASGDRLTIGFADSDTELVYRVESTRDWMVFRLERVRGTRPSRLTLVQVPVVKGAHVGRYLNAVWDERWAVCLRAANLQTDCRPTPRGEFVELAALTQDEPGPRLEGSAAALIVASPDELRDVIQRFAATHDLPQNTANGVSSKDLPIARDSYWFLSFGEKDVERVIQYCQQSGFRQVMLNSGAWCTSPGHYTFRTSNYPDGIESLRRTVARLHEHGILVGMHCFASKVSKRDPYVTPVPDRRFWVDSSATLAQAVGAEDTSLPTRDDLSQWPGSPVAKRKIWEGGVTKHQEVVVDDEIVQYESIGPEGRWDTLFGCRRGAWGTRAAAHEVGTDCRRYGVDGCINGYIIDQETQLLDETTSRLAHVFNTCDFDMLYFDGGEDVDRRRFNYYASNFQAAAMSKFRKRPLIHMGTVLTHGLWHSFTRSGTYDTYENTIRGRIIAGGTWDKLPTVRDHIDRSVQRLVRLEADMLPAELGWFGIWPKGEATDGLQLDEIEYLMAKSLAHNAPISLQTSFARMESHPLTPGILEIVREYEQLRKTGELSAADGERLQLIGRDYVLFRDPAGPPDGQVEFVRVEQLANVAEANQMRCLLGPRGDDTVATVWHYLGREATISLDAQQVVACGIKGNVIPAVTAQGRTRIAIGPHRTTLLFRNVDPAAARRVLSNMQIELRQPTTLWIQAEDFVKSAGNMARGSAAGVEEEAFGDVVVCTGPCRVATNAPDYVEYRAEIPRGGRWTLWARVRYPRGGDDSFGIVRAGEPVTLAGNQVLGNCGAAGNKWHWTGRGGGVPSRPPGAPVTFRLDPGPFVFRVHAREGGGSHQTNPRLDLMCLTEDPEYVPTDDDVPAELKGRATKDSPDSSDRIGVPE